RVIRIDRPIESILIQLELFLLECHIRDEFSFALVQVRPLQTTRGGSFFHALLEVLLLECVLPRLLCLLPVELSLTEVVFPFLLGLVEGLILCRKRRSSQPTKRRDTLFSRQIRIIQ